MANKQKILIVDDRAENLYALERTLRETKCEIVKATSGNDALAATLHHDFALAILDVQMPLMSGFELAEYLRGEEKMRWMPIIFLSAVFSDEQSLFKGYEAGAIDYIVKPYNPVLLLNKVKVFLELAWHRNHLEEMLDERTRELADSEQRLRDILAASPIGIGYVENEVIQWANESMLTMFGYKGAPGEEGMVKRLDTLYPSKEEYERVENVLSRHASCGEAWADANFRRRDGSVFDGHIRMKAADNASSFHGSVVTISDISEQKHAEQELLKGKETVNALLNATPEIFILLDRNGTIEEINQAVERFLGKPRNELIGEKMFDFFPPEVARLRREKAREAFESGLPVQFSDEQDGTYFENTLYPIVGKAGVERLAVYATDITDQVRAQAELRQRERAYRTLSENIPGLPYRVFLQENDRMEFFNDMVVTLTGYAEEELCSGEICSIESLILPEDLSKVGPSIRAAIRDHKPFVVRYRLKHKNGDVRFMAEYARPTYDADGNPLYIDGVVFDDTERRRAEELVAQSEERFRATFEQAAVGIAHIAPDGRWLRVNRRLSDIVGYPAEELKTLTFQDITHPEDLDNDLEHVRKVLDGEIETYSVEKRYIRKDGSLVWINLTKALVREDSGAPRYFVSVVEDISHRKAVEESLKDSEERYRDLYDNAPDMYLSVAAKTGEVIDCNDTMSKVLGFSKEEIIGRPLLDLYHPDCLEAARECFRQFAESGTVDCSELQVRRKDGTVIDVSLSASSVRDENGTILHSRSALRDISARKSAEEQLRQSQEQYSRMAENVPGVIYQYAQEPQAVHGEFLYISTGLKGIYELEPDDVRRDGNLMWSLIHPDDVEAFAQSIGDAAQALTRWNREWRIVTPSGLVKWIHGVAQPTLRPDQSLLWDGLLTDITDRKATEKALRESKEILSLRDRISHVFLTVHDEAMYSSVLNLVLEATGSKYGTFGYVDENRTLVVPSLTRDIWEECRVADKTVAYPYENWGGIWGRALKEKTTLVSNEPSRVPEGHIPIFRNLVCSIVHKGESVGLLHIANKPSDYDEHDHALLQSICDQIAPVLAARLNKELQETQRMKMEADREQLISELEDKNAELEQFTYTVSHDLKSPLVTIKTFCGYVDCAADEENREMLHEHTQRISNAAEKMGNLLDELLTLSRIGRLDNPPSWVPFGELVQEAAESVAGRIAEHGVALHIASDLPAVHVDRPRLVAALQNLIDNAVKFCGDQPHPKIEIGLRHERDEGVFYVRDNGMGIDPKYHQRVFRLFERLDPSIDGTGAGLALVKRIVEVHGGRIWVESEGTDHGCVFCFTLPGNKDREPGERKSDSNG